MFNAYCLLALSFRLFAADLVTRGKGIIYFNINHDCHRRIFTESKYDQVSSNNDHLRVSPSSHLFFASSFLDFLSLFFVLASNSLPLHFPVNQICLAHQVTRFCHRNSTYLTLVALTEGNWFECLIG